MALITSRVPRYEKIALSASISLYSGSPIDVRFLINEYLDIGDFLSLMAVSRSHYQKTLESAFQNSVWAIQQKKLGYAFEAKQGPLAHQVIRHTFRNAESLAYFHFKFIEKITQNPEILKPNSEGHLHTRVALKALRALLRWLPHRNTLSMWAKLAIDTNLESFDPLNSIQETAQKASEFSRWILQHQDTLDGIKTLEMRQRYLIYLEPALGQLTALKSLYLHDNGLRSIPPTIGQLSSLRTLMLQNNRISSLPDVMGNLSSLEFLDLEGNCLSSLPLTVSKLSSLYRLNLSKNRLTSFPDCLGQLPGLVILDFHSNRLSSSSLGPFGALQTLDMSNNQLTSFSACHLPSLYTLNLSKNRLASFSVGDLPSLHKLELQGNKLTFLDENIGQLASLKSLKLHNNFLNSVPETIFHLAQLTEVDLYNNPITEGSDVIKRLRERNIKVFACFIFVPPPSP
ncbi:MAG: leucine-rich repeat domain-containing protein [Verrucomicrobia bacterium]|nr:leucine-rich repeat domain-containing protein [Verrucomicrobiota bacterium]